MRTWVQPTPNDSRRIVRLGVLDGQTVREVRRLWTLDVSNIPRLVFEDSDLAAIVTSALQHFPGDQLFSRGNDVAMTTDGSIAITTHGYAGTVETFLLNSLTNEYEVDSEWSIPVSEFGLLSTSFTNTNIEMDSEGKTLAISVVNADASRGATLIYTRDPSSNRGDWNLLQIIRNPDSDLASYGIDTHLSDSGRTLCVGNSNSDVAGTNRGAISIFRRDSDNALFDARQAIYGRFSNQYFGNDADLFGDSELVVGNAGNNSSNDEATVFRLNSSTGQFDSDYRITRPEPGDANVDSDFSWNSAYWGSKLRISGDGLTLVISGRNATVNSVSQIGAISIFTRNNVGDTWNHIRTAPKPNRRSSAARWGFDISLSHDGRSMYVGAFVENSSRGAVYYYELNPGQTWTDFDFTQDLVISDSDAIFNGETSGSLGQNIMSSRNLEQAIVSNANGDELGSNFGGVLFINRS